MDLLNLSQQQTQHEPVGHQFSPYTDNGGTSVAIAGKDYVVVASDTRLSEGYMIYTRNQSKLFKLSNMTVLSSTGCWCDVLTFVKVLQSKIKLYHYEHGSEMSTEAIAQLVSNNLYSKRFFPYYVSNMVGGIDSNGKGAIYTYDPVGSFDRVSYRSSGSSSALIQPLLDNQIGKKNQINMNFEDLSLQNALGIVKDAFISATERDIYCGDSVHLQIITNNGIVNEELFQLRKD